MKPKSFLAPFLLLAVTLGDAAGNSDEEQREVKRLLIDVERIRRLEPSEQKKEVERLYRTIAPRIRELNRYHLRARELDYTKGRDDLTPEAWVQKAWSLSPDAFMYLLWDTRTTGYAILDKQRTELRPLVLADLASKNEKEVKWALHVISEVGGKEFFQPVLEVFEKNAACSEAAIYALRHLGDPRAIAHLVHRHPDLVAVFEALRTLQHKRPADPTLVARLDAKDAQVRWRAAYALSESGDPALVGHIEKLVRDEHPPVRQFAADMGLNLEKEAYQRVRPAILALANDPDPAVKKFVVMCLVYRRDPACGKALLAMARDTNLSQREHYDVVHMIRDLTGTEFGYDTRETVWRPNTEKNQEALRRFAEWVEKNSGHEKGTSR